MKIALLLSSALFIAGFFEYIRWFPTGQISVLYAFFNGYNSGLTNFLIVVFPIIACLPFAASFIQDHRNRLTDLIYIRTSTYQYKVVKFFLNGMAGGIAVAAGPFVGMVILSIAKLIIGMPLNLSETETALRFNEMGIDNPYLMMTIVVLLLFYCGFIFSSIGLACSVIARNSYLAVLLPLVLYIVTGIMFPDYHSPFNLQFLYDINRGVPYYWPRMVIGIILILLSAIVFSIGGKYVDQSK